MFSRCSTQEPARHTMGKQVLLLATPLPHLQDIILVSCFKMGLIKELSLLIPLFILRIILSRATEMAYLPDRNCWIRAVVISILMIVTCPWQIVPLKVAMLEVNVSYKNSSMLDLNICLCSDNTTWVLRCPSWWPEANSSQSIMFKSLISSDQSIS